MASFPHVLSELRRRRGLTQKALAEQIGKSTAYVSALEAETAEKTPSLDTLRELVGVLAADKRKLHGLDVSVVLPLIGSVFGWTFDLVPPEVSAEMAYTEAFQSAGTVWSVSDVLIQALSPQFAKAVARKILSTQTKFVFLVPFNIPAWQCASVIDNLERCGLKRSEIAKHVSIFYMSLCAFPGHYQICDPLGPNAQGFYFIGSDRADGAVSVNRMPQATQTKTVEALWNLCSMFHNAVYSGAGLDRPVGDPTHGYIQLQYPLEQAKESASRSNPSVGVFRQFTSNSFIYGMAQLQRDTELTSETELAGV